MGAEAHFKNTQAKICNIIALIKKDVEQAKRNLRDIPRLNAIKQGGN